MADKPTTPDASDAAAPEPRRKKRAGPTIDLTASEVPPPAPEPAAETPPAGAPPQQPRPGPPAYLVALAGGAAGAAIVAGIGAALWFGGVLQVAGSGDQGGQVASMAQKMQAMQDTLAADRKTIDAMNTRVAAIQDALARLPAGNSGMAERLTTADNAMKSLGVALAALNKRSDGVAATAAEAKKRADEAVQAVSELRASVQEATKNASSGISAAELDVLQKRIAALEQSSKAAREDIARASSADRTARLALSAAALHAAVASGAPYADALAQVKALGGDEKKLATLAAFAATGVPTPHQLAQELHALLPEMVKISGAPAPHGGFLERLQANAGKLVRIQPIHAPSGNDASAVLARLEIDSAKADIATALTDLDKLDAATRAPAQAWIDKAKSRAAALSAARQVAADTARALGPQ